MSELSIATLMMSIQAVKHELRLLNAALDKGADEDDGDNIELLLCYEQALSELKQHYIQQQAAVDNYPDYEALCRMVDEVPQPG
ncbi:MAG: hypothetical protein LAT63_10890 [Marinobacter sp.]|nr:hypothetical protein [Marinobacter sp.]